MKIYWHLVLWTKIFSLILCVFIIRYMHVFSFRYALSQSCLSYAIKQKKTIFLQVSVTNIMWRQDEGDNCITNGRVCSSWLGVILFQFSLFSVEHQLKHHNYLTSEHWSHPTVYYVFVPFMIQYFHVRGHSALQVTT